MTTDIKESIPLPDGKYKCHWGGYEVWFDEFPGMPGMTEIVRLTTTNGIRTPDAPAILTVKDCRGTIESVTG